MQFLKFSLVVAMVTMATMVCALSAPAEAADCRRISAVGETLTHDTAVLFSTNALKNTLAAHGRVGKGPVRTTCETGSAITTCRSSQMACTGATPKTCLGAWLCF